MPVTKRRPALVISSREFSRVDEHSILAMITSARRSHWQAEVPLSDLSSAGLAHASMIRWKIFTLPSALIDRKLGHPSARDSEKAAAGLRAAFALARAS